MANRKVLLLLDNCSAHIPLVNIPNHIQLQNTTVFYLPPNTTSKIQPCDAGIIRNFKAYYWRHFNCLLLQCLEDQVETPEKIDILQAIRMAVMAWTSNVKPETIRNCFCHCKIRTENTAAQDISDEELIDNEVRQDLQSQVQQLGYQNPMTIRSLLNYPGEEVVAFVPTVDDLIKDTTNLLRVWIMNQSRSLLLRHSRCSSHWRLSGYSKMSRIWISSQPSTIWRTRLAWSRHTNWSRSISDFFQHF